MLETSTYETTMSIKFGPSFTQEWHFWLQHFLGGKNLDSHGLFIKNKAPYNEHIHYFHTYFSTLLSRCTKAHSLGWHFSHPSPCPFFMIPFYMIFFARGIISLGQKWWQILLGKTIHATNEKAQAWIQNALFFFSF